MKTNIILSIAVIAALAGCTEVPEPAGKSVALEKPAETPAAVQLDRGVTLENAANRNTELVTYTWHLGQQPDIAPTPKPYTDVSHEYRLYVTGEQLASGIDLPITQEGALIAITPIGRTPVVDPARATQSIRIQAPTGQFAGKKAVAALADGQQMEKVGDLRMHPAMIAFRTAPEVGTGSLTLKIDGANHNAAAVIQVVERKSPHTLSLTADKVNYFVGDRLTFSAQWSDAVDDVDVNWARLRTPNGRVIEIPVDGEGQLQFSGGAEVQDLQLRPGELVDLEVDTTAHTAAGPVHRTAKTSFAIARRTAALRPNVRLTQTDKGIRVPVEIEVGSGGRFAVTGILYGTNRAGEKVPFLGSQTATMLEPGTQTLTLVFSPEDLGSDAISAPYEIRNLHLQDQSRMFILD